MPNKNLIDLTGQRFGRLEVLKYNGNSRWECKCDCGKIVYPKGGNLRKGYIHSCGCLRKEVTAHMVRREHGFTAFGKLCEKGVTIQMIAVITFMVAGVLLCVKNGRNMNHLNYGL